MSLDQPPIKLFFRRSFKKYAIFRRTTFKFPILAISHCCADGMCFSPSRMIQLRYPCIRSDLQPAQAHWSHQMLDCNHPQHGDCLAVSTAAPNLPAIEYFGKPTVVAATGTLFWNNQILQAA